METKGGGGVRNASSFAGNLKHAAVELDSTKTIAAVSGLDKNWPSCRGHLDRLRRIRMHR